MSEENQAPDSAPDSKPVAAPAAGGDVEEQEVELAGVLDRFFAYILDVFLFLIPARLTISYSSGLHPDPVVAELLWHLLWTGAYILYQTAMNAGGRRPLGKAIMGLHVATVDGEPLGLGASLIRAIGYIFSGAFLEVGFLWVFTNPKKQTWHDVFAGTVVVETSDRPAAFRGLARLLSVALLLGLGATSAMRFLRLSAGPEAESRNEGLLYVAELEEEYKVLHGAYTEDASKLAALDGGVERFREHLSQFVRNEGFGIKVEKDGYAIVATGPDGAQIHVRGPLPPLEEE